MLLASTIRLPHGRLTTASDPTSSTSGQLTGGYSSSKHSESPRITGCAPCWGTGAHLTGAEGGMGLRATLLSPVLALSGRKGTQCQSCGLPSSSSSQPNGLMMARVTGGRAPRAVVGQGQGWGTQILSAGQVPLPATQIVPLRAQLWFGLSPQEP